MMKKVSIFNEVLGPVMRGPSSSHTAASYFIGRLIRDLLDDEPEIVTIAFAEGGAVDEGWSVRRLNEERRKYSHPFLGKWTDEAVKKNMGAWHAVRFFRNQQVDEVFTREWELLKWDKIHTPFKCEFTRTIPAKEAEPPFICPNDIEWVITNPQQKGLPLGKRDAWFFFCSFCAEMIFSGI
ncbi:unnamed protein product, partial [marine sediment metagenome]